MKFRAVALLLTLALGLLAAPLSAEAEQAGKLLRIGLLFTTAPATDPAPVPAWVAFWQGMRELGWVEGENFLVEIRSAEGKLERLPDLAAELVRLKVDVFVLPVCDTRFHAVRKATSTIPIVVPTCNDDLVRSGVIASLARPGGNITGLSKLTPELAGKRLELLKEAFPKVSRVAVLWNPDYGHFSSDWQEMRAAARRLGVTLQSVEFRRPEDFESAFSAMIKEHAEALISFSDVLIYVYRRRVVDLAAQHRLPAMHAFREVPDAGGLMSYGPDLNDMWRRAASHVDKILKGAKAGDLPMEQPVKFELVINLKTAKALGLTIPPSVLFQADRVIK